MVKAAEAEVEEAAAVAEAAAVPALKGDSHVRAALLRMANDRMRRRETRRDPRVVERPERGPLPLLGRRNSRGDSPDLIGALLTSMVIVPMETNARSLTLTRTA